MKKGKSKKTKPKATKKKKLEDYTAEELEAMPHAEYTRLEAEAIVESLNKPDRHK